MKPLHSTRLLFLSLVAGCGGTVDNQVRDAGREAAVSDTGPTDTGTIAVDAGPADTGVFPTDLGVADTGPADAGTVVVDSGPMDTGVIAMDTGPADAGPPDGGPPDTGPPDTGPSCVAPQALCGGQCVNPQTDPAHCGTCNNACPAVSNGSPACAGGSCGFVCNTGFVAAGGACVACGGEGQPVCTGVACNSGLNACGGTCRNTASSTAHCGASCTVCPVPTNGSATCTMGACGITCNAGFEVRGAACVSLQRSCTSPSVAGCGLVDIPGGTFTMGGDSDASNASVSQPNVTVRGFRLDRDLVTVARFRQFWDAPDRPMAAMTVPYQVNGTTVRVSVGAPQTSEGTLRCASTGQNWGTTGRDNHPINCVDWHTAMAFCMWDGGRLPTEAEWEWAARAPDSRQLPWGGNTQIPARVCSSMSGSPGAPRSSSCAVDDPTFMANVSAQGVRQLVGNMWEWVADNWSTYSAAGASDPCINRAARSNPLCTQEGNVTAGRVQRGGTWISVDPGSYRSASRSFDAPSVRGSAYGFRCARDIP